MQFVLKICFLCSVFLCALSQTSLAERSSWQKQEPASVRLISATDTVGTEEYLKAGLQVKLASGWKTYWRLPGDGGLAPEFDWSKSVNVKDVEILWPAPKRFTAFGIDSYGYDKQVVFPLKVTPKEVGAPISLALDLNLFVCSDVCVPAFYKDLKLDLGEGALQEDRVGNTIARFEKKVPVPFDDVELKLGKAWASKTEVRLVVEAAEPLENVDLFLEYPDQIAFFRPVMAMQAEGVYEFSFTPVSLSKFQKQERANLEIGVTLTGVDNAREGKVFVEESFGKAGIAGALISGIGTTNSNLAPTLWAVLVTAFIGGMILNVMPCVLPVLSIKVMSLIKASGQEKSEIRKGFFFSALGIVSLFLILALAALLLRQAGVAVGWGMQFQQPAFLIFMVLLLILFAFNLFGKFDFALSGTSTQKMGAAVQRYQGTAFGNFLMGAFAALLATPCSAPFVGTAIGYALSTGGATVVLIFVTMALGLALPYLLIAAFPRVAYLMPKPGAWMHKVKIVMGGALLVTAVWLGYVLSRQIDVAIMMKFVGFFLIFTLMIASLPKLLSRHRVFTIATLVLLAVSAIGAAAFVPQKEAKLLDEVAEAEMPFKPFDPAFIAERVSRGDVVFVDITASWCVTCQANKSLVLSQDPTYHTIFDAKGVTPVQADWTRYDPAIAEYLAQFGRYGIPFNIVYGPDAPNGVLLPELLSHDAVSKALGAADKKRCVASETQSC